LFTSSYPCTFKLGNGIYDFTPFKLATNSTPIPAVWSNFVGINFTDPQNPVPIIEAYTWNFTFCEYMSVSSPVPNDTPCRGEYFVAGANAFIDPLECTPFSGSSYKDIVPSLIPSTNVTYNLSGEIITGELSGVSIQYTGGSACASTGSPTTFTIKVYCNSSMSITDYAYEYNVTTL